MKIDLLIKNDQTIEVHSQPCETFMMERFVKVVSAVTLFVKASSQLTFTCLKPRIEKLEKNVKYAQN